MSIQRYISWGGEKTTIILLIGMAVFQMCSIRHYENCLLGIIYIYTHTYTYIHVAILQYGLNANLQCLGDFAQVCLWRCDCSWCYSWNLTCHSFEESCAQESLIIQYSWEKFSFRILFYLILKQKWSSCSGGSKWKLNAVLNAGIKFTLNWDIKTQDIKHDMNKMNTIELATESQCQELQDCWYQKRAKRIIDP